MLVVPDANVLYSDPFLERPLLRTILAAENLTDIRLGLPEVVVDELRRQVEMRVENVVRNAAKVRRDYAALAALDVYAVDFYITSDQRQAVVDRFNQRMDQIAAAGGILAYPSASPRELAQRSIRLQPPFKDKDRGLRDTLIWLTVKEYLQKKAVTKQKVILVTDDGAFWNQDKTSLHELLQQELENANISPELVILQRTLQSVIDTFISDNLSEADWVKVAIEGGGIKDFTASDDAVLLIVNDWILSNPEIFEDDYGPIAGFLFVEFDVIEQVSLQRIEQTLSLGSNEVTVTSEWICTASAQGYDNPYFGDYLEIDLRFTLSSIIQVDNGRLSVLSHEVTDMRVDDLTITDRDV